jgi:hypothetical protein
MQEQIDNAIASLHKVKDLLIESNATDLMSFADNEEKATLALGYLERVNNIIYDVATELEEELDE